MKGGQVVAVQAENEESAKEKKARSRLVSSFCEGRGRRAARERTLACHTSLRSSAATASGMDTKNQQVRCFSRSRCGGAGVCGDTHHRTALGPQPSSLAKIVHLRRRPLRAGNQQICRVVNLSTPGTPRSHLLTRSQPERKAEGISQPQYVKLSTPPSSQSFVRRPKQCEPPIRCVRRKPYQCHRRVDRRAFGLPAISSFMRLHGPFYRRPSFWRPPRPYSKLQLRASSVASGASIKAVPPSMRFPSSFTGHQPRRRSPLHLRCSRWRPHAKCAWRC